MDNKCEAHIYQVLTDECQDGKLDSNYVQFTTVDIHECLYLSLGLKKIVIYQKCIICKYY